MNLNQKLINLFATIDLEAEQDEYIGKKQIYVIFTYEDERPVYFGNNSVLAETAFLQIQLITPKK